MKTVKTMTDDLRLQIIQEYLDGATKYSLIKKYNLGDKRSINSWMLKFGIENPRSLPTPLSLMPKKKESEGNRGFKEADKAVTERPCFLRNESRCA